MTTTAKTICADLKRSSLWREITAALLIKILLLWGLWFVVFRDDGENLKSKPDIAEIFQPHPEANVQPSLKASGVVHDIR